MALAGLLGVPLGKMLLRGLALVIPTVAIWVAIMLFLFSRGWWDPVRDERPFLGSNARWPPASSAGILAPVAPVLGLDPVLLALAAGPVRCSRSTSPATRSGCCNPCWGRPHGGH